MENEGTKTVYNMLGTASQHMSVFACHIADVNE